ncbi:hypothetical protein Golax_025232, partial [Gossypium laxum]|nr:hypothetical protein [Gossypium laxum]
GKWEGSGFCVPSPHIGRNVGDAHSVCEPILRINTLLHKDVSTTILACNFDDIANDVGMVQDLPPHFLQPSRPFVPDMGCSQIRFSADGINKKIEEAILKADRMGVKVISLAALNKNEALNGGGTLFVNKHPQLKVRVCHGNTLTAAVIVNEIPKEVKEVFLTGSTSKLGRAIALYLCRRRIRV